MRKLPRKDEILKRARGISSERAVIQGLPAITPTEAELKESGVFHEARIGLMRGADTEGYAQQHRYVAEMASEMGLVLLRRREHREQLRKVEAFDVFRVKYPSQVVKVNGFKITVPSFQKPKAPPRKLPPFISKAPVKPKRKKRQRLHTQRNGKTMRKLRKHIKNGKTVFAFPDDVWKVRKI